MSSDTERGADPGDRFELQCLRVKNKTEDASMLLRWRQTPAECDHQETQGHKEILFFFLKKEGLSYLNAKVTTQFKYSQEAILRLITCKSEPLNVISLRRNAGQSMPLLYF